MNLLNIKNFMLLAALLLLAACQPEVLPEPDPEDDKEELVDKEEDGKEDKGEEEEVEEEENGSEEDPEKDPEQEDDPDPDIPLYTGPYENVAMYGNLKDYVNRTVSPDFKMGAAIAAGTFLQKSQLYELAVNNLDEMTA